MSEKLLTKKTSALVAVLLIALSMSWSASAAIEVAGDLLVDLSAADASAGTATWINYGSLGDFNYIASPNDLPVGSKPMTPDVNGPAVEMFEGVPVVHIMSDKTHLQAYMGPDAPETILGDNDRSIEIWAADLNADLQKDKCLVAWGIRANGQNCSVNLGYKGFGALGLYSDPFDTGFGEPQPSTGVLHHLVYVIDSNNTATIYVDGVVSNVRAFDGVLATAAAPINLLVQNQLDSTKTNVVLSDSGLANNHVINSVRIHSGELTAEQVMKNFQAGPSKAAGFITKAASMGGFDFAIVERLELLGYAVTIIDSGDVKSGAFSVEDAEALNVIVVSEVIGSSDVIKLAGAKVPMMNGEGYGWHKMNYAESDGSASWQNVNDPNGNSVAINDASHPIVVKAGLNAGPIAYLTNENATATTASVSSLAPGAANIASIMINDTEYALVFAIDEGAQLAKDPNNIAAARIVGFSLPGNQDPNLSDEGWALFDASILWLSPAHVTLPAMVAHWPLDQGTGTTATDVVGNNDGTLVGGVSWLAEGGVSFDVNDPNAAIAIAHSEALDFNDVDFAISMMVRYPVLPGSDEHQLIIKGTFGSPDSGSRYVLFHKGTAMRFEIDNGPANAKSGVSIANTAFVTGEWVNLVVVRDTTNDLISLYADGVLQVSGTDKSGAIASGEEMRIGNSTKNGRTSAADIADVRIFPTVLTEEEIGAL